LRNIKQKRKGVKMSKKRKFERAAVKNAHNMTLPEYEATRQLERQFDQYAALIKVKETSLKGRGVFGHLIGKPAYDVKTTLRRAISYTDIEEGVTVTLKPGLSVKFTAWLQHDGSLRLHVADVYDDIHKGYRWECVALSGATDLESYSVKAMAWLVFSRLTQIEAGSDKNKDNMGIKVEGVDENKKKGVKYAHETWRSFV
jgi:hypothetical protein